MRYPVMRDSVPEAEQFVDYLRQACGADPELHVVDSTTLGESAIACIIFRDVPEGGCITAFTYGLSRASHAAWKLGKPELMIAVNSADAAWAFAIATLAETMRYRCAFSYGDTVNLRRPIAEGSAMSAFLVFAPPLGENGEFLNISLPSTTVNVAGLYPIYEGEIGLLRAIGFQRFWDLEGFDPFDVSRPDLSKTPGNWAGAEPDA